MNGSSRIKLEYCIVRNKDKQHKSKITKLKKSSLSLEMF